jgi:glycerol transport system ATP-binding protein
VGRHRIVRAELMGQPFNVLAPEGMAIGADMTRVAFAPGKISVYADDWRVAGKAV